MNIWTFTPNAPVSGSLTYDTLFNTITGMYSIPGTWNPYNTASGTWDFIPYSPITGSLSFTSSDASTPPSIVPGDWTWDTSGLYYRSYNLFTISSLLAKVLNNTININNLIVALTADPSNPIVTALNFANSRNPIAVALNAAIANTSSNNLNALNSAIQSSVYPTSSTLTANIAAVIANPSNNNLGIALAASIAIDPIAVALATVLSYPLVTNNISNLTAALTADPSNPIITTLNLANSRNFIVLALNAAIAYPTSNNLNALDTVIQSTIYPTPANLTANIAAVIADPSDNNLGVVLAASIATYPEDLTPPDPGGSTPPDPGVLTPASLPASGGSTPASGGSTPATTSDPPASTGPATTSDPPASTGPATTSDPTAATSGTAYTATDPIAATIGDLTLTPTTPVTPPPATATIPALLLLGLLILLILLLGLFFSFS